MRRRQRRVLVEGVGGRLLHALEGFFGREIPEERDEVVGARERRVGEGVVRIQHDRLLECLGALHHVPHAVVVDPPQVCLLRLGILPWGGCRVPRGEPDTDLLRDGPGDVLLKCEDV